MDGVLFIDEAYDLDPAGDYKGKPIVSELLVSTVGIRILNVIRVVDLSPNVNHLKSKLFRLDFERFWTMVKNKMTAENYFASSALFVWIFPIYL